MKEDNSLDHPRELSPPDRKRWKKLCEELLELYDSMPMGKTTRKAIVGCKEGTEGVTSWLMLFRGVDADVIRLRNELGEMK